MQQRTGAEVQGCFSPPEQARPVQARWPANHDARIMGCMSNEHARRLPGLFAVLLLLQRQFCDSLTYFDLFMLLIMKGVFTLYICVFHGWNDKKSPHRD